MYKEYVLTNLLPMTSFFGLLPELDDYGGMFAEQQMPLVWFRERSKEGESGTGKN